MSQIPPAPGQPAPYGQPTPPGQPAPYGQPPGNYQLPVTQSNAWGITSLITGLVSFCVPFIGGLLAILFGALGLKKSKITRSGGGLSIVGLILGLLSIGMWALFGGGIFAVLKGTEANREAAKLLVRDISAANMTAAQADTDGSISQDDLQSTIDAFKLHGAIADVTCPMTNVVNDTAKVVGVATFADKFQFKFQFDEVKAGGKWKVSKINILP